MVAGKSYLRQILRCREVLRKARRTWMLGGLIYVPLCIEEMSKEGIDRRD